MINILNWILILGFFGFAASSVVGIVLYIIRKIKKRPTQRIVKFIGWSVGLWFYIVFLYIVAALVTPSAPLL
ncbi:hypothetical protein ACFL2D_01600 [Patescibacteria group bacterium]